MRMPKLSSGLFVALIMTSIVALPLFLFLAWEENAMLVAALAGLIGWLLGLLYPHISRGLGLVPYCYSIAFFISLAAVISERFVEPFGAVLFLIGIAFSRLSVALNAVGHLLVGLVGLGVAAMTAAVVVSLTNSSADSRPSAIPLVVALGLLALVSWPLLLRPAIELACEPIIRLQYRIRSVGPGVVQIPIHGPSIVIANHACWFDPFFLALLLPRPITPMMTSDFYDLPVAHWLLKSVFHAIRVPEKSLKQDVPDEIREAIAALDRGECVVIFPEGMLRRSEEKPLKRFGRGVWQILAARPHTPVFACWIEGGWRSYCSYFNGPPTKNKRLDFRRHIAVAVPAPITVDAEILSKHLTTRIALMNAVLKSRKLLELPEVPAFELPKEE